MSARPTALTITNEPWARLTACCRFTQSVAGRSCDYRQTRYVCAKPDCLLRPGRGVRLVGNFGRIFHRRPTRHLAAQQPQRWVFPAIGTGETWCINGRLMIDRATVPATPAQLPDPHQRPSRRWRDRCLGACPAAPLGRWPQMAKAMSPTTHGRREAACRFRGPPGSAPARRSSAQSGRRCSDT